MSIAGDRFAKSLFFGDGRDAVGGSVNRRDRRDRTESPESETQNPPPRGDGATRLSPESRYWFLRASVVRFLLVPGLRLRDTHFLVFVLKLVELPINAALGEQLLVAADLADLALVHDDDLVGSLNG